MLAHHRAGGGEDRLDHLAAVALPSLFRRERRGRAARSRSHQRLLCLYQENLLIIGSPVVNRIPSVSRKLAAPCAAGWTGFISRSSGWSSPESVLTSDETS